jgi:hypothetical protein
MTVFNKASEDLEVISNLFATMRRKEKQHSPTFHFFFHRSVGQDTKAPRNAKTKILIKNEKIFLRRSSIKENMVISTMPTSLVNFWKVGMESWCAAPL